MRLASLLTACLVLGCAHSPEPAPGPRPLGMDANLTRGEATLAIRLRYETSSARSIILLVDLDAAGKGSVGVVEVTIVPEGFMVGGPAIWSGEVQAGTGKQLRFPLRVMSEKRGRVTITHRVAGGPASDPAVVRFLINDDEIRACQASEEGCEVPDAAAGARS